MDRLLIADRSLIDCLKFSGLVAYFRQVVYCFLNHLTNRSLIIGWSFIIDWRVRLIGMGMQFFHENLAMGTLINEGTFIRDRIVSSNQQPPPLSASTQ